MTNGQNRYILAIDGGTQSTKVALFDLVGNEICAHTVKLKPIYLYGDDRAEHPDDDLWDSLKLACQTMFDKFDGDKSDIVGVGLGSIRCCRALIKQDGTLASPVQSWMDLRLSRPYEHDDDTVRYVTTTTGYLTHRLTGEAKDTRSNYVGPWPIDPVTLDWYEDGERFDSFTTPREMLFELVDPSSILGHINAFACEATGIPKGLPVVSTANDKAVEGLGAGLVNDGTVLVTLGTYIASMMVGDENRSDTVNYWSNPGAVPGEFLYESSGIRRGMATVTWIKDLLGEDVTKAAEAKGMTPEAYLNAIASEQTSPGCDGLYTVLHWLARPTHLYERGMIIGFNGTHKGPHMFRSVLEGIAMTMKNHAQAMCDERGVQPTKIIVSGGGSNGDLFMQIFADVFGVPACRNEVNGSASMGAAICTALALGIYKDRSDAINHMVRIRDVFEPVPENVTLYNKINETVYKHLAPQTEALLKASHEIFRA
ncbi:FGGY-family carbohydrate kinase [Cohaesibacter celericrescens]|uniref:Sugar kinase n=1 Tax=Cohaesibacter celericrescens TaxID=2067669 RepID=A0A2N5XUV8_9HYPH|nr:FGGY-family carbohydrate kinase [Cohaesibacter celericrescens]PLW78302.1 sugar kinase [Cohaesibacter celericrescens]